MLVFFLCMFIATAINHLRIVAASHRNTQKMTCAVASSRPHPLSRHPAPRITRLDTVVARVVVEGDNVDAWHCVACGACGMHVFQFKTRAGLMNPVQLIDRFKLSIPIMFKLAILLQCRPSVSRH